MSETEQSVAEARRDVHESLALLPAWDADRVRTLVASLEAAVAAREAERLEEARMWARHGYEIDQIHCGWSDYGVAPGWLTEGWPRHFRSCPALEAS